MVIVLLFRKQKKKNKVELFIDNSHCSFCAMGTIYDITKHDISHALKPVCVYFLFFNCEIHCLYTILRPLNTTDVHHFLYFRKCRIRIISTIR